MLVHCCFFLFHLWIVFCLYFSCRYKLHQHTCIWTLWSYICLICSILSWHSDHITIPYLWPKFQRQIIHLPSWSSGQSLVINGNWISLILHFLSIERSNLFYFTWQLLLSSWKRSLIPGIFGLVAGSLYRLNVFGIRKMKVTGDLFPFCASVLLVLHCYLMWQIAVNILFACWYCSLIHCPGTYCA